MSISLFNTIPTDTGFAPLPPWWGPFFAVEYRDYKSLPGTAYLAPAHRSFTASGLPPGLSISGGSGEVSGTVSQLFDVKLLADAISAYKSDSPTISPAGYLVSSGSVTPSSYKLGEAKDFIVSFNVTITGIWDMPVGSGTVPVPITGSFVIKVRGSWEAICADYKLLTLEQQIDLGKKEETMPEDVPPQTQTPVEPQLAPLPANGLSASYGDGQISLSWMAAERATNYTLYYRAGSSVVTAGDSSISAGGGTSFTHTGLSNGTKYCYRISSENEHGSNILNGLACEIPKPTPAPPVITATNSGDDGDMDMDIQISVGVWEESLTLVWKIGSEPSAEDNPEVFSVPRDDDWATTETSISVTFTGNPGEKWYFGAFASNNSGNSPLSIVSVTLPDEEATV